MRRISPEELRELARQRASFTPRIPQTVTRRGPSKAKIREIMIEKWLTPYLEMTCGHYTHREAVERDSVWAPAKHLFYCDKCDDWLEQKPKPKASDLPEIPPF